MSELAFEVNFDGIVGPTHNYAGLSYGNLASQKHGLSVSNPKEASLQGLAKMKFLADLGLRQAVLPPQERPNLGVLRQLGFAGSDAEIIRRASREEPRLLAAAYSASSMWAANAATVSPSADTADGLVHFTPANLVTQLHRSIETTQTANLLKTIFRDESAFAHHDPLPASAWLADEGAANHTRLCDRYGAPGIEIFVYGRVGAKSGDGASNFPARQTLEASAALARLHRLDPAAMVFARQDPRAIDAGAFHNDVVAVGNCNVVLYHELAYANSAQLMEEVDRKFSARSAGPLYLVRVPESEVSLKEAVETYLFNSQLVSLPDGTMSLIAPTECQERPAVQECIERILAADNPIRSVHYLDVRQSMKNGGGPACLRLRVVLSEREVALIHPGIILTESLYAELTQWVGRHYRDRLEPEDLGDPKLADESRASLDELTRILRLGAVYPFQR